MTNICVVSSLIFPIRFNWIMKISAEKEGIKLVIVLSALYKEWEQNVRQTCYLLRNVKRIGAVWQHQLNSHTKKISVFPSF